VQPTRPTEELEAALGYQFGDKDLLRRALTHRSYANENPHEGQSDNEKLEFLGDAVLDLIVGHLLMNRFPELSEGQLSVTRARIVSEFGLSRVAEGIVLGDYLFLGKGEERSGGRHKASILADSFEALIAAVYLDGGYTAAWQVIATLFGSRLGAGAGESTGLFIDHKTLLQELAQARFRATPEYQLMAAQGPDHDKTFAVAVFIAGREWGRAQGKSKKEAEQGAARAACSALQAGEPSPGQ
jgi:ribonuclease III